MEDNRVVQDSLLTTDDLVLMIGEKEVTLFQTRKVINELKIKCQELQKLNDSLTADLQESNRLKE